MYYKTKNDYQKLAPRSNVHTTIREDIYEELQITAIKLKQHQSKCLDVIIEMVLKDEKLLSEFKNRVMAY